MFTTKGKTFIKRYLAGQAGSAVGAISVGIGATAATIADERLQFEIGRVPVDLIQYDFVNDKLVFKGTLPADISGKIYEVGIWSTEVDALAGNQGSRIITTFDSESEEWDVETFETTVARIGPDSLKHTPAANASSTSNLPGLMLDFSDNTGADKFVLALNVENAFTANVVIRFMTDDTNYYSVSTGAIGVGYQFVSWAKSAAAATGTPSWDNITNIRVVTTATAGGSASVEYDGLRIEDIDTVNPEYGLIARFIPTPTTKVEGQIHDVEYSLAVTL